MVGSSCCWGKKAYGTLESPALWTFELEASEGAVAYTTLTFVGVWLRDLGAVCVKVSR